MCLNYSQLGTIYILSLIYTVYWKNGNSGNKNVINDFQSFKNEEFQQYLK